ncbi:phosphoribosyltransferase [Acidipropionibacterium thoenii]|uniref:phosphoribosyltransferase n=1 Tax=Acidipropionibacterium thoenii TaxID=1751 RepID=UPI0006886A59|nr:phosphoribosyltransferase [Acidipropionibacterium thoenii]
MTAYHADSSDLTEKEVLTWSTFGQAQEELAQQIADSGFQPEVLISIARGGMLLGGALTYSLGVKLTDAVNVEFYTDVNETLPDPVLLAPMLDTASIKGRRILVVDDVADSGRTLKLVLELLRDTGAEVRSAVLYTKPTTVEHPDYQWKAVDRWIVFPWSAKPPVTATRSETAVGAVTAE